jgi:uncharacterized surface protein with fasciclin (FAS1) repeats
MRGGMIYHLPQPLVPTSFPAELQNFIMATEGIEPQSLSFPADTVASSSSSSSLLVNVLERVTPDRGAHQLLRSDDLVTATASDVFWLWNDAAVLWDLPMLSSSSGIVNDVGDTVDDGLTLFWPSKGIEAIRELNERYGTHFLQPGYELHSYGLAAYHLATEYYTRADLLVAPAEKANEEEAKGTTTTIIDMVAGGTISAFDGFDGVYLESSAHPAARLERSVVAAGVGMIHVLERALLPGWATRTGVVDHLRAVDDEQKQQQHPPVYSKFRRLIKAAGMTQLLSSSADLTLLAPHDEAIPDDWLDFLTARGNSALAMQVVGYHVLKQVINHLAIIENDGGHQIRVDTFQGSPQDITIQLVDDNDDVGNGGSMFIGAVGGALATTYGRVVGRVRDRHVAVAALFCPRRRNNSGAARRPRSRHAGSWTTAAGRRISRHVSQRTTSTR